MTETIIWLLGFAIVGCLVWILSNRGIKNCPHCDKRNRKKTKISPYCGRSMIPIESEGADASEGHSQP